MKTVRKKKLMVRSPLRQRIAIHPVSWKDYLRITDAVHAERRARTSYDRGTLEIMTSSHRREVSKKLLSKLIDAWTLERDIAVKSGGSNTLKKEDLQKGLEPDECFWIAREAAVRGVDELDLAVHPPPDLVVEIDASRSSVGRYPIYAALGVPEVWRLRKGKLGFLGLQPTGVYAPVPTSLALPPLAPADVGRFLALRGQTDETSIVRQFRQWVRSLSPAEVTPPGPPPAVGPA